MSNPPKIAVKTALKPNTVLTENTITEGLPNLEIACWTTQRPTREKTKQTPANNKAKSKGRRPRSQNCTTDKEDEKNTMKAVVAAVSCTYINDNMHVS